LAQTVWRLWSAKAAGLAFNFFGIFRLSNIWPITSGTKPPMAPNASATLLRTSVSCPAARSTIPLFLAPSSAVRHASGLSRNDSRARDQPKKKKKARTEFINQSLKNAIQFSLCDAMRYTPLHGFRDFEVCPKPFL